MQSVRACWGVEVSEDICILRHLWDVVSRRCGELYNSQLNKIRVLMGLPSLN